MDRYHVKSRRSHRADAVAETFPKNEDRATEEPIHLCVYVHLKLCRLTSPHPHAPPLDIPGFAVGGADGTDDSETSNISASSAGAAVR